MNWASSEARNGDMELKESVRHIGNAFLSALVTSQQEAAYLALQMPIMRISHEVIFIPTSHPDEWTYLLKDYETLKKMEPESNEIQTHSLLTECECHPRKFEIYSLADFASLLQIIYPKCITLQDPFDDNVDDDVCDSHGNTEKLMIELFNGIVIKQQQNLCIIHYRNYSKKTDLQGYYREKLVLFYHWRKEDTDLIGKFDTYEEDYKVLEDQILPVQLKYERNNDILQEAMEEINAEQNQDIME